MLTVEMLKNEIDELEKKIASKESEISEDRGKISAYKSLIEKINSQKKPLTENDLVRVAKNAVKEDPQMQRVKKIVSALRNEGFDVDGNSLSAKLIKTGKFRINKDTKYWEDVDLEGHEMFN
jgi:hypothetical protein